MNNSHTSLSLRLSLLLIAFVCFSLLHAQPKAGYKQGEIMLMFEHGLQPPARWQPSAEGPLLVRRRTLSKRMNLYLYAFDARRYASAYVLKYVRALPQVQLAQFNHYLSQRKSQATFPNDPRFHEQWNLHNTGANGTEDADIDAPEAWDIATGGLSSHGDTLVVAIIDVGVDLTHQDLQFWKNHNEIPGNNLDDDNNGYVDDYDGWNSIQQSGIIPPDDHGTHVAGIAAARGNNGLGISGVSWNTQIMPVAGSSTDEAEAVAAYGYVLEMRSLYNETAGQKGAFVVATNASFGVNGGLPEDFPIWCAVYDALGQAGVLNAGATANSLIDVEQAGDIPTRCTSDFLIGVTNTTPTDELSSRAAFGAVSIDLGAPGTGILSTFPDQGYGNLTGTSMATPHVTGAIALMLAAACPNLLSQLKNEPESTLLLLKGFLLQSTDPLPDLQGRTVSGGRLNLNKCLQMVQTYCSNLSDCVIPYNLRVSRRRDTSVRLNWQDLRPANGYLLQYRPESDTNWQQVQVDTNFFDLSGLSPCTSYFFRVEAQCDTASSGFSSPKKFLTEGCCDPPVFLGVPDAGESRVQLLWKGVFAAQGYELQYRQQADTLWQSMQVQDTTANIDQLQPCTPYELRIKTLCGNEESAFSDTLRFRTSGCGFCIDTDYCLSSGQDSENEWIAAVQIGPLVNESGNDGGYGDFSSPAYELLVDVNYPVKLSPGFSGSFLFQEYWRIWIDLNQDGDFEDADELVFDPGRGIEGEVNGSLRLPPQALPGNTRMRVSMAFVSSFSGGDPPTPCSLIEFGEVEDYCINVRTDSSFCATPWNTQAFVLDDTRAQLGWEGRFNSQEFHLRYRPTGSTNWAEVFAADTLSQVLLTDLMSCTTYEWQIQAVCAADSSSAFSSLSEFTTKGCGACVDSTYCPASAENSAFEWIDKVRMLAPADTLEVRSGSNNGYGDFTGMDFQVARGGAFTLTLVPGFSQQAFNEYWRVWLDLDHDGLFDEGTERVFDAGIASRDSHTVEIFVPPTAKPGITRMRIAMKFVDPLGGGSPPGACELYNLGEVEDYCVRILQDVGIEQGQAFALRLYPNPFEDLIRVESEVVLNRLLLFNQLGQLVWQHTGAVRSLDIPAGHLPQGLYWLQAYSQRGRVQRPLLKQ